MESNIVKSPELPDILQIFSEKLDSPIFSFLYKWESITYSVFAALLLVFVAWLIGRNLSTSPKRKRQMLAESIVGGFDDFICQIIGPKGRKYTPFIGTLFLYVLIMNLMGLIPFLKSPTASLSVTLALSLCVFVYVQYTAFKELGFFGVVDHLAGSPRGFMLYSIILPVFMFCLHIILELIKPLTLSLRLRSNVWGDDILMAIFATFGYKGIPLLLFSMITTFISSCVQAFVFTLLTVIYFALILTGHEDAHEKEK